MGRDEVAGALGSRRSIGLLGTASSGEAETEAASRAAKTVKAFIFGGKTRVAWENGGKGSVVLSWAWLKKKYIGELVERDV